MKRLSEKTIKEMSLEELETYRDYLKFEVEKKNIRGERVAYNMYRNGTISKPPQQLATELQVIRDVLENSVKSENEKEHPNIAKYEGGLSYEEVMRRVKHGYYKRK